jgi:hypothetical protein
MENNNSNQPTDEIVNDFLDFIEVDDTNAPVEIDESKKEQEQEQEQQVVEEKVVEEEPTSTTSEEEDIPLVELLRQQIGYEAEEDESFEDTEEGITNLVRKASEKLALQYINEQLNPTVKEFQEFIELGGDPTHFLKTKFSDVDYTKVEFDENDTVLQERLVKEELVARGYKGEELEAELSDIKNGGILESKAKRALVTLKNKQISDKNNLLEQQRQLNLQRQQEAESYWNDVRQQILKSSSFKNLRVPETKKTAFFDFISKPVKDGKSERDLKLEKLTLEDNLAVDWLLFNDFNLETLVTQKAKDLQAKTLRERLRGTNKVNLDKKNQQRRESNQIEELATL